ncbi:MAG: 5-formyltetrahydrofolate cyclo-ligase [Candidatus Hydrogenedens sp.]|jgi:5-formyltetrahydrofolate cyclo-ligase|nr:5-formyltetrahydrofolate cyclo-ligase [Candidatus Hydrogenedens sp.]
MPSSFSSKLEARTFYLNLRRSLSPQDWRVRSDRILAHLTVSDLYLENTVLLCYVSAKDGEVDTHALIDDALARNKTVFIPVLLADQPGAMAWAELTDRSELIRGSFGLFEVEAPCKSLRTSPVDSLCIVPGIAFSVDGHRLGYGGGYYDRFLAGYGGLRVGLGFSFQENASFPRDNYDEALHYLIAEDGIRSF